MIRSRAASLVPTARSRPRRLVAGAALLGAVLAIGPGLPAAATSTHPVHRTNTHLHPATPASAPRTSVVAPADWWW